MYYYLNLIKIKIKNEILFFKKVSIRIIVKIDWLWSFGMKKEKVSSLVQTSDQLSGPSNCKFVLHHWQKHLGMAQDSPEVTLNYSFIIYWQKTFK